MELGLPDSVLDFLLALELLAVLLLLLKRLAKPARVRRKAYLKKFDAPSLEEGDPFSPRFPNG